MTIATKREFEKPLSQPLDFVEIFSSSFDQDNCDELQSMRLNLPLFC